MKIFSGKSTEIAKEQKVEQVLLENYDVYYRLAYSYVKNEADAGDIVQNGAYRAIKSSSNMKKEEYASTWVYRIMLNEIFRFYGSQKAEVIPLEELPVESGKEDKYEDIDLQQAIDSLSKEDKAVIELRYFEDRKIEEIADILGENVNTIKSRLYRSMKKLKTKLV